MFLQFNVQMRVRVLSVRWRLNMVLPLSLFGFTVCEPSIARTWICCDPDLYHIAECVRHAGYTVCNYISGE